MTNKKMSVEEIRAKFEKYCEKTLQNDLQTEADMKQHNAAMRKLNKIYKDQIKEDETLQKSLYPELLASESMRTRAVAAQYALLSKQCVEKAMWVMTEIGYFGENVHMRADSAVFMSFYLHDHKDLNELFDSVTRRFVEEHREQIEKKIKERKEHRETR